MPSRALSLWPAHYGPQNVSNLMPWITISKPSVGYRAKMSYRRRQSVRHASTARTGPAQDERSTLEWPTSRTAVPTPYEIFKQKKGSPYSKRRFYELVKIYHPDRNMKDGAEPNCPSRALRLERYRLIVLANEILSDPIKRDAYDRWGAGWGGQPEVESWTDNNRRTEKGWSGFQDNRYKESAWQNATWEDWERWHHRSRRNAPKPLYFSNGSFVVLIALFAVIGGAAELSRAKHMSRTFLQQIEDKHDDTSKALLRSRKESQSLPNQDERVQNFLRMRNPGPYGASGPQGAEPKRLPPPKLRLSGGTKGSG